MSEHNGDEMNIDDEPIHIKKDVLVLGKSIVTSHSVIKDTEIHRVKIFVDTHAGHEGEYFGAAQAPSEMPVEVPVGSFCFGCRYQGTKTFGFSLFKRPHKAFCTVFLVRLKTMKYPGMLIKNKKCVAACEAVQKAWQII